jgi:hypothetical protein
LIYCQTLPLPHGQIWSRTLCGVRQILELIAEGNRIKARVLLLAPALHWSGYQWEDSGCFFTLYRGPSIPPLESSCKIIRGETVRFNVEAPRIKTDAASIHCSLGLLCIQKRLHRAALFFFPYSAVPPTLDTCRHSGTAFYFATATSATGRSCAVWLWINCPVGEFARRTYCVAFFALLSLEQTG